jgi:hypothetical protein
LNKTVLRSLSALLFAAGLAIGLGGVSSAAHADTGYGYCWESGCNGLDPIAEDCATNAVTVWSGYTWNGDYLDLRYSPDCDANWARVFTAASEPFFVRNANGDAQSYTSAPRVMSWTNMVNGHVHAWACVQTPPAPMYGNDTGFWVSDNYKSGVSDFANCQFDNG